jgi:hypothetical protein
MHSLVPDEIATVSGMLREQWRFADALLQQAYRHRRLGGTMAPDPRPILQERIAALMILQQAIDEHASWLHEI